MLDPGESPALLLLARAIDTFPKPMQPAIVQAIVSIGAALGNFDLQAALQVLSKLDPGLLQRLVGNEAKGLKHIFANELTFQDGVEQRDRLLVQLAAERAALYRHGPFDLLEEIERPEGAKTKLIYDHALDLVAVRQQNGLVWSFERDPAGQIVRETDFDGVVTAYVYDPAGRRIETSKPDGSRVRVVYDRSSLAVLEEAREASDTEPRLSRYAYDLAKRLKRAENEAGILVIGRDERGSVTSETWNGRRIESSFDCCGNRTSRRIADREVKSAYEPLGQLKELSIGDQAPLKIGRDALGRETSRDNGRGFVLRQEYDIVGQLLLQELASSTLTAALGVAISATMGIERGFQWNRACAPLRILDRRWGEEAFVYDQNEQVVEAARGGLHDELFHYDPARNIIGSASAGEALTPWLDAVGGRTKVARGPRGEKILLQHDACGRVTERRVERDGFRPQVWRYDWDGEDSAARLLARALPWRFVEARFACDGAEVADITMKCR